MKIAIVCSGLDTSLGGGLIWTMRFINWLADAGHEVHVVTHRGYDVEDRPGVVLHELPSRVRTQFARLAEQRLIQIDADISHDMGCTWAGDIFHSHVGSPQAFYKALVGVRPWWKRLGSLRIARMLPRYRETDLLVSRQFSASRNAYFIALSEKIVDDFQSLHGIDPMRISLIHNGVDAEQFQLCDDDRARQKSRSELGIAPDDVVLLQVARNPELKGVAELIRAAGFVCDSGAPVRVVIVGCKPRTRLRNLVQQAAMTDRVHFVPATKQIEKYYQLSDACVHPTHYDACSLTVLEAMASGLPVVTTRCNGAADLLTHGKDGFVLESPRDPDFPEHLRALLAQDVRKSMGQFARQTAVANTLENNFENIFKLYEAILSKKRAARRVAA